MQFFMPKLNAPGQLDPEEAEQTYAAIAQHLGAQIPSPRIRSLSYDHNGKGMRATVGEPPDEYYKTIGPVVAIYKNPGCYVICTPYRGVSHEGPILASTQAAYSVTHFDAPPASS